jgi:AraC-like DNA-binding protein
MKHWYQKPHPKISDYVRTVLVIDGASEPDPSSPPLVTNAMTALFHKDGELTLFGKSVPSECWEVTGDTHIIAYLFKPFAAASIFNVDARTLAKEPVKLGSIGADEIDDLIIGRINPASEIIKYATDQIMLDPSTVVLSNIIRTLNINERTFQRIFKKYVGVTAVQYRRICQFELAFSHVRSNEFQSLTDIAYANGFADQSHFIRSFKEFANTTPNNYLKSGLKD